MGITMVPPGQFQIERDDGPGAFPCIFSVVGFDETGRPMIVSGRELKRADEDYRLSGKEWALERGGAERGGGRRRSPRPRRAGLSGIRSSRRTSRCPRSLRGSMSKLTTFTTR